MNLCVCMDCLGQAKRPFTRITKVAIKKNKSHHSPQVNQPSKRHVFRPPFASEAFSSFAFQMVRILAGTLITIGDFLSAVMHTREHYHE